MKLKMTIALALLTVSTAFGGDYQCEIVDTDTDASLESAGVNPTCPDNKRPWACYCEIKEVCEDEKTGHKMAFTRSVLMGCGDLSDCNFWGKFGQRCDAMES